MSYTLAEITSQIQEHDAKIAELRRQAEALRNQERASVIEEVRRKIAEYGLTATELRLTGGRAAGKRGAPAPVAAKETSAPKYISPTGETWSGGRGRKPRWVMEALEAGKNLEDFEIK